MFCIMHLLSECRSPTLRFSRDKKKKKKKPLGKVAKRGFVVVKYANRSRIKHTSHDEIQSCGYSLNSSLKIQSCGYIIKE